VSSSKSSSKTVNALSSQVPARGRRVCLILGVEQTTARLLVNHRQFPERVTGLDTPASTELIL